MSGLRSRGAVDRVQAIKESMNVQRSQRIEKTKYNVPFWMLFVRLPTVTYRLRSELDQTIIKLSMCPIVSSYQDQNGPQVRVLTNSLWIRSIAESK